MELEFNSKFVKDDGDTFTANGHQIMFTPAISEDYWILRVKLSEKQAILGFPKFGLIGIGFAVETDWNTNLPSQCETEHIYNHIKHNKGDKNISKAKCIEAIEMVKKGAEIFQNKKEN